MFRTSIALFVAMNLAGCVEADSVGDAGAGSSESGANDSDTNATDTMANSTTGATGEATGGETSDGMTTEAGDSTATDDSGSDDSESDGTAGDTTGGPDAGTCAMGCEEAIDCCPLGAVDCPSETYPDNWSCVENVCVFGGCSTNDDCESGVNPGQSCHEVDGTGVCFDPCAENNDCEGEATCTGVADDGMMFCELPVPACEDDSDCNGAGICDPDSGACYCEGDTNCTAEGADVCVM